MPRRKASWAIAIWTAFMAVAIFAAALGIGEGAWLNGVIGLSLLGLLWFVVFAPLWIVWYVSRPKQDLPA